MLGITAVYQALPALPLSSTPGSEPTIWFSGTRLRPVQYESTLWVTRLDPSTTYNISLAVNSTYMNASVTPRMQLSTIVFYTFEP